MKDERKMWCIGSFPRADLSGKYVTHCLSGGYKVSKLYQKLSTAAAENIPLKFTETD